MSRLIATAATQVHDTRLDDDALAALIAHDIPRDTYVNLGIGRPTLIADHLDEGSGVILHTENGMLGMGPRAEAGCEDFELTNASKVPVTERDGASYFDAAQSFALMRGGHLDLCVLGGFQVSTTGDLANWSTGADDAIPAVGGAMDLAFGAKTTYVMMSLFTNSGEPKLMECCTYPLTASGCVDRVYTDYACFEIKPDGVHLLSTWGMSVKEIAAKLDLPLTQHGDIEDSISTAKSG